MIFFAPYFQPSLEPCFSIFAKESWKAKFFWQISRQTGYFSVKFHTKLDKIRVKFRASFFHDFFRTLFSTKSWTLFFSFFSLQRSISFQRFLANSYKYLKNSESFNSSTLFVLFKTFFATMISVLENKIFSKTCKPDFFKCFSPKFGETLNSFWIFLFSFSRNFLDPFLAFS